LKFYRNEKNRQDWKKKFANIDDYQSGEGEKMAASNMKEIHQYRLRKIHSTFGGAFLRNG